MDKLIVVSREYLAGCEALHKGNTFASLAAFSQAISGMNEVLLRGSVPRKVKLGLRKNLAIMYSSRAVASLSRKDKASADAALRDAKFAEKQDPTLNLV
jgi:hypothetical protein